jgi:transcriptional regulator with XRE-family HTH domain
VGLAAKQVPTPLAYWRQRAGKTQAALAEQIGVSQPFLAQIEGGQRQGTVKVLARFAKAVGVRIEDLID